jgi:Trk K+ transport system NAD-binding subunit
VQRGGGMRRAGSLDTAEGVDSLVDEVPLPEALVGCTFEESRFRERFALALLLVRRGTAGALVPEAALRFAAGDRLVVFGTPDRVAAMLRSGAPDHS